MGSRLIAGEDISEEITEGTDLWSTSVLALMEGDLDNKLTAMSHISQLEFNNDFESIRNVSTVSDLDKSNEENYYGVNHVYKDLYDNLFMNHGWIYDIRFFNYDWRYSNSVSAEYLKSFVNTNNYDKVVLIAHSMGGLVVSKFLADIHSTSSVLSGKIENCIFIATPFLGTPMMPYIIGSGNVGELLPEESSFPSYLLTFYNIYALLSNETINIHSLLKFLPSLYELIPTEKYFLDYEEYNTVDYFSYLTKRTGNAEEGYEEIIYGSFYDTDNQFKEYIFFSNALLNAAQSFHAELWSQDLSGPLDHITFRFSTYYVIGYDEITPTHILRSNGQWSIKTEDQLGDSLLPIRSASIGDMYPDRTYYTKCDHMSILCSSEVIAFINSTLNNTTVHLSESFMANSPISEMQN